MKQFLFYLLLVLSLSTCKEESNTPVPETRYLYTDSLTGTSIYTLPEPESAILKIIPHATKVELFPENPAYTIQRDSTIKWRKIIQETTIGWVFDSSLSEKIERHYFSVVTTSGIPLRETPYPKSKILATIPLGYIGEFYYQSKENVIIDKKPGFWIETIYNGKRGWIFSGLTVNSKNLQTLEERMGEFGEEGWFYRLYSNLETSKLEEIEFDPNTIEKTATIIKFENHPYTIYQVKRQVAEDDCSGKESQIIFKNNLTGKSFGNREIFSEVVVEQNHPLIRSVYTASIPQKCGCFMNENTLYFLLDDRILAESFKNTNTKAYCEYGPVSYIEIERENRYDLLNNQIYIYLKLPECEPDEKTLLHGGKITEIKKFKTDMFISLELTNKEVLVEKFYQKGIPEQFLGAWKTASLEPKPIAKE